MAARSKARKRAVDVLYAAELRGRSRPDQLADEVATGNPPVPEHTVRLVEGVTEHAGRIDELIDTHARGWSLERLPGGDRLHRRAERHPRAWRVAGAAARRRPGHPPDGRLRAALGGRRPRRRGDRRGG